MPWQIETERLSVLLEMAEQQQRVAARLRRLRQDAGDGGRALSQEEAAARAGLKTRQWQRWEAAENMPRPRSLEQIATAFGIEIGEFYDAPAGRVQQISQLDRIETQLRLVVDALGLDPTRGESAGPPAPGGELGRRIGAQTPNGRNRRIPETPEEPDESERKIA